MIKLSNYNSQWRVELVDEPDLVFAKDHTAADPRSGLLEHGPVPRNKETPGEMVNIGIIGTSRSISMTESLLRRMRNGIQSTKQRKRWKHHFPGLGLDSELRLDYQVLEKWKSRFTSDELDALRGISDRDKRIEAVCDQFEARFHKVCRHTPEPDVIFVALPEEIVDLCADPSTDTERIQTESGGDFHSRIKIMGMKYKPTQIMTPRALYGGKDVQEQSEIAWNLAVGLLYKARGGRPWKLTELRSQTCYAGISFYKEHQADPDTRAAIAQVFISSGEPLIIEGGTVEDAAADEPQTHLSYEDAKRIVSDILEGYGNRRDEKPNRLVLHKSSNFLDDETRGFRDGASDVNVKEFITIRDNNPIQFFPEGDNPPLRGTLAIPPGEKEYYLYTTGFVPEQSVYNHGGSPNPLVIRPHPEYFTGDYLRICEEVMKFTKLNWNSSDFCQSDPVTLSIADAVGDILAEPAAEDVNLDSHYFHYM